MELGIGLFLLGSVIVGATPVVAGLTRERRKNKKQAKVNKGVRKPLSDKIAHERGLDKYEKTKTESVVCTSLSTGIKVETEAVVNSMFNSEEDILLKGMLYDPSATLGKAVEVIYLYQPAVKVHGELVRPSVKDGVLSDDAVYLIRDNNQLYTFYTDKREVSSGLPFDYVISSKHGRLDAKSGLNVQLDFRVVDLRNEEEKAQFDAYIEERKKDGYDNRDRYQAKIDNSRIHAMNAKIEKDFADRSVEKKDKKEKVVYDSQTNKQIRLHERVNETTERLNNLTRAGAASLHNDHYDFHGGMNDPHDIGVNGRGRR